MTDYADSTIVTLRVADLGWVQRLVFRLGGAATVLDPPQLARTIHAQAEAALAQYVNQREPVHS